MLIGKLMTVVIVFATRDPSSCGLDVSNGVSKIKYCRHLCQPVLGVSRDVAGFACSF